MAVEMSKCKRGDRLRARNGDEIEYIRKTDDDRYWCPHLVENLATAKRFTVCENGYFSRHAEDEPHELDIVEIVGGACV